MRTIINSRYTGASSYIASIPSLFYSFETTLHHGRNEIRMTEYLGEKLVVKRFCSSSIFKQLITTIAGSKAKKAYINALKLTERGIETPFPIAYIEERNIIGLITKSYLVTAFTDMKPICGEMNEFGEFNKPLMKDFAQFAAKLHKNGIIHNDLNSTNVRWQWHDGHYSFSVIDTNRMRVYSKTAPDEHRCMGDLTRFCSMTDMYKYFILEYLKARGWSSVKYETALYIKQKHDRNYDRRKKVTRRLKSILCQRYAHPIE